MESGAKNSQLGTQSNLSVGMTQMKQQKFKRSCSQWNCAVRNEVADGTADSVFRDISKKFHSSWEDAKALPNVTKLTGGFICIWFCIYPKADEKMLLLMTLLRTFTRAVRYQI